MPLLRETFPVGRLGCNCTVAGCSETGEALVVDLGDDADRIRGGPRSVEGPRDQGGSYPRAPRPRAAAHEIAGPHEVGVMLHPGDGGWGSRPMQRPCSAVRHAAPSPTGAWPMANHWGSGTEGPGPAYARIPPDRSVFSWVGSRIDGTIHRTLTYLLSVTRCSRLGRAEPTSGAPPSTSWRGRSGSGVHAARRDAVVPAPVPPPQLASKARKTRCGASRDSCGDGVQSSSVWFPDPRPPREEGPFRRTEAE